MAARVRNPCRIEQSNERTIANIAFANYRSCRASSTGSTRTQFLVWTGERCHQVPPKAAPSHVRLDFMLNHSEWSDVAPGQFLNVAPEHVPWCRSRAGLWRAGQSAH